MSDITAEVEAAENRRWAAQLDADVEALAGLLADELSYTHSNGLVDTRASYLDAIANKVFDYRSADRSDVKVDVIGETAVITGRVVMLVVAGGREVTIDGRYSAVWARRDGRWQFVCWQSTPIPKPA